MRFNHFLSKNANCESPNNLLIIDTEANIKHCKNGMQIQTFRLGYAIHLMRYGDSWSETGYELHSIDDFHRLLDSFQYDKKRLYVVAHNMAYDYAILKIDTYLASRAMDIKMRVIDNVFIVRSGNIHLISSTNFYRQSLKELGVIFGLDKMDAPDFDDCDDSELMPYCKRDTEVLTNIMKQHIAFVRDNNLGNFKETIAGQSMNAFRHRFMKTKLLAHNWIDVLELEKNSYRGGRCEAFRIGSFKDITSLDINSMYPFVMRNYQFPTRLISCYPLEKMSVSDLEDDSLFMIAECDLKLNQPVIACKREKLLFPIGKIKQVITSPEIEYILNNPECGKIVKVNKLVTYEKDFIFKEFVDYFYSLRQSTDNSAIKAMAKVILNSLYGKFGQRESSKPSLIKDEKRLSMYSEIMRLTKANEIITGLSSKIVKLGDKMYEITGKGDGFATDSIPSIASAVTSYARMELFRTMVKAGLENVYYCDTDSVFVNRDGLTNLSSDISDKQLGKLKIEKSGDVTIHGAKDYIFNGIVKLKGVKHDATLMQDGRYLQMQFQTKHSRYSNGSKDGEVFVKPVIKSISGEYTKGIVKGDRVVPFSFVDC